MLYHSTRGTAPVLDFRGVTLAGLANDGGLYVPQSWPQFSADDLCAMRGLPYQEIASRVMQPFIGNVLDAATLRKLVNKSYSSFTVASVTPLLQLDPNHYLLELFHGPTLAFKDVALQLLGLLFEHFLQDAEQQMTVVGATSGDTGSAAMSALAGRRNITAIILYPHNRPSEIQRRQMTCLNAPNIHALAIEGSFDDCQAIVKNLFNDAALRQRLNLAAVNSINWARILAQIVYYFVAAVQVGAPEQRVSFVVPTGNFGNIYAGFAARQCGLPIEKLVVASNRNDILPRFFASGTMQTEQVAATFSPSMDIQISSNFERLLFALSGNQPQLVRDCQATLAQHGSYAVAPELLQQAQNIFAAQSVDDAATLQTIRQIYQQHQIILDPHSAVGMAATQRLETQLHSPVINLACAHPAKFPETIRQAIGIIAPEPAVLSGLMQKPEYYTVLPPQVAVVRDFIMQKAKIL